jgi:hypothetical protein
MTGGIIYCACVNYLWGVNLEVIYYTLIAGGLYFMSDWILDRIEISRGERFQNRGLRSLVFFLIILVLAFISFGFINYFVHPLE